jgi:hypothetical protein
MKNKTNDEIEFNIHEKDENNQDKENKIEK